MDPTFPLHILLSPFRGTPRMMAVDASPEHAALVSAWTEEPKDPVFHTAAKVSRTPIAGEPRRVAVLVPQEARDREGQPFKLQVELPIDALRTDDAFSRALRQWRGWAGLRHWIAFLVAFTDAGRKGQIRWRLRDHLDLLHASKRHRNDPAFRKRVCDEVDCFLRMEVALYGDEGRLRVSRPLVHVLEREERRPDATASFLTEGLHLTVNPALYQGAGSVQKFGKLWFPGSRELAGVSHVTDPHALPLGLLLPMRWRWRAAELGYADGCRGAVLHLRTRALLDLAGITVGRDLCRATGTLRRALDTLCAVGALGSYGWAAGTGAPWTRDAVCLLTMPEGARQVLAGETTLSTPRATPDSVPSTGNELRQWRREKGLSRAALAAQIDAHFSTLKAAERKGDLSARLRAKLYAWMRAQAERPAAENSPVSSAPGS